MPMVGPIVRPLPDEHTRLVEPGVYTNVGEWTFAILPERYDGYEVIPFSWATEMPEVAQFIERFPTYWMAEPALDRWRAANKAESPDQVYWCRYDPRRPR